MTDNHIIEAERALLISLDTGEFDAETSMNELEELAKSAGADPAFTMIQRRQSAESATLIGSGFAKEAAELCERENIELIIFDSELTPTQIRNLEKITDVRVIDRTMLILDIFALRAKSKEGKLQVELAQLKYMLPRLTGKGVELSRLGGGIGTRGPGETKLETDRRHISAKLDNLKAQLKKVEANRDESYKQRKKSNTVTAALVGYTNAGKSTLMNTLTQAGVLVEDKLFATLDPTARALKLPNGKTIVLIDTVGLVRRLPHHLVEAFKSTLEQAASADIILNVCDASSDEAGEHLQVTNDILNDLRKDKESENVVIPVLNKWDLVENEDLAIRVPNAVRISAKSGKGVDELLEAIEANLPEKTVDMQFVFPFAKAGLAAPLRGEGAVLKEEYTEDGLVIEARVSQRLLGPIKEYAASEVKNNTDSNA